MDEYTWTMPRPPALTVLVAGLRIGYQWPDAYLAPVRWHYWHAYWNPRGGGAIVHAGRRYPLAAEHVVLIPPECRFRRESPQPMTHWWAHFHAETPRPSTPLVVPCAQALRRHAHACLLTQDPGVPRAADALHTQAFLLTVLAGVPLPATPGRDDPLIADLMADLHAQHWPAWSNAQLAARVAMHEKALVRRFRRATGESPQLWLRTRRLDRAADLLAGDSDIAVIAEQTGFADRAHFSKAFRARRGMGPATYRRWLRVNVPVAGR